MLLLKLGCTLSGCHRNIHITRPQLIEANIGHAWRLIFSDISALLINPDDGWTAIFAKANTTRAKTYITICWFTEEILPVRGERRPKTT